MADLTGLDPTTNTEATVPQEAAASLYKAGKPRRKKTEAVPVKVNGVEGTSPQADLDEALQAGAELNFDPHGAIKAGVAGALDSATLGASNWAAIEGSRLL